MTRKMVTVEMRLELKNKQNEILLFKKGEAPTPYEKTQLSNFEDVLYIICAA